MREVDCARRLRRLHQVQVMIGRHLERPQHLVEHGAVLRRHAQFDLEIRSLPAEVQQHRAEFDGFGPGAQDE